MTSIGPKPPTQQLLRPYPDPTLRSPLPIPPEAQTGQRGRRSSLLQSSSCYIVVCHSISAALFVCTVIWWENFVSLCPLRLDRGHVGGWEMKRRRCGRIQSLSSGFKACFTHSLWTVVCKKCLWMCLWRSNTQPLSSILVISGIKIWVLFI